MKMLNVDAAHLGKQLNQLKPASQMARLLAGYETFCDHALNGMLRLGDVTQPVADVFDRFGITYF